MSLPRYLKDVLTKSIHSKGYKDLLGDALVIGMDIQGDSQISNAINSMDFNDPKKGTIKRLKVINDIYKHDIRMEYSRVCQSQVVDNTNKMRQKKYIGLDNNDEPIEESVWVSRFFADKLSAINEERERHDTAERQRLKKKRRVKNKVYHQAYFPPLLKQILLEEANYTCVSCGMHRDTLIDRGLHLEIDHKTEREDGGETYYQNGQVLCSDCNKGKHQLKAFFSGRDAAQV